MALATDCNPGSSPVTSLLLMLNMGATLFRLTPEETLAGVTRNAAKALGLGGSTGTLQAGKRADFAVWNIDRPAELSYRIGFNPLHARIWQGKADAKSAAPARAQAEPAPALNAG
jgi:imidazolonepropionase